MEPLAQVGFLLKDELRSFHASDIRLGNVVVHGMRIDSLPGAPAGHDAYLIKVNYDIDFDAGAPSPKWSDIGLRFTTHDVLVNDALPRSVTEKSPPVRFAVTTELDFIRFEPDLSGRVLYDHVPMPSVTPTVDCRDIGSPGVRWRRTGAVGAGSHIGWLTIITPIGCQELSGEVTVDYALDPSDNLDMDPRSQIDGFTVRLPHNSLSAGISVRLGFTVDVVGYSMRSIRQAERVQNRLWKLVTEVLANAGVTLGEKDVQRAGDGLLCFFPTDTDLAKALETLLTALPAALATDNRTHDDQIRLRMAMDIGTVGLGPLGFTADAAINFCRLVDSAPIREAIKSNPDTPIATLVSGTVHDMFISRFDEFAAFDAEAVDVVVKNYQARAYLLAPKEATSQPGRSGV